MDINEQHVIAWILGYKRVCNIQYAHIHFVCINALQPWLQHSFLCQNVHQLLTKLTLTGNHVSSPAFIQWNRPEAQKQLWLARRDCCKVFSMCPRWRAMSAQFQRLGRSCRVDKYVKSNFGVGREEGHQYIVLIGTCCSRSFMSSSGENTETGRHGHCWVCIVPSRCCSEAFKIGDKLKVQVIGDGEGPFWRIIWSIGTGVCHVREPRNWPLKPIADRQPLEFEIYHKMLGNLYGNNSYDMMNIEIAKLDSFSPMAFGGYWHTCFMSYLEIDKRCDGSIQSGWFLLVSPIWSQVDGWNFQPKPSPRMTWMIGQVAVILNAWCWALLRTCEVGELVSVFFSLCGLDLVHVHFWGVLVHVVQQETEMPRLWQKSVLDVLPTSDLQLLRGNNGWKPKFTTSNPLESSLRLALFRQSFGDENRRRENLILISPVSSSKPGSKLQTNLHICKIWTDDTLMIWEVHCSLCVT